MDAEAYRRGPPIQISARGYSLLTTFAGPVIYVEPLKQNVLNFRLTQLPLPLSPEPPLGLARSTRTEIPTKPLLPLLP